MLESNSSFDSEHGPKMVGPHNTHYGREVSQVETRAIDTAAIEYVQRLSENYPRRSPLRILDLGCGTGFNAERFARMGCEVTAVDLRPDSPAEIAERNRKLAADGLPEITFVGKDIITLDVGTLSAKPWDVVFLNRVLHFVPENSLERILQSVTDASAPHTHFVINFRSSDYKTRNSEGRTFIESDEDGCLPTYYLHNGKKFISMLERLGCSVAMHEEHDRLCLLFVKNAPGNEPSATLAPVHPGKRANGPALPHLSNPVFLINNPS